MDVRKRLARRVVSTIRSPIILLEHWMPVLINPEYDFEGELRNNVFYVLVGGLYDAVIEAPERMDGIRRDAEDVKSFTCSYYADFAENFIEGIADLLSIFSIPETVYLREMRTQSVHAHLDSFHRENRSFPVVEGRSARRVRVSQQEYWNLYHEFRRRRLEHDASDELRRRFMYHPSLFWEVQASLRWGDAMRVITEDIHRHEVERPTAWFGWENGSYWDTLDYRKANGPPLPCAADHRASQHFGPKMKDPAFP